MPALFAAPNAVTAARSDERDRSIKHGCNFRFSLHLLVITIFPVKEEEHRFAPFMQM